LQNGAKKYTPSTNPSIRTVIKDPINFNSLLTSFVDVQRAAQVGGILRDDPTKAAWRLTFQADGTFLLQSCVRNGTSAPEDVQPICGPAATYAVPANGAIYLAQTGIVSGQVNGRVTVASNNDIIVANNISYVQPGDDVLGLAAKNNVIGPRWAPLNLTWTAAVLAQSGTWQGAGPNDLHNGGTMTHIGSSTTDDGGGWTAWTYRSYSYDQNLLFLPPPWFPTIEDAYTVVLFREL
jgi:hypothetical protein